MALVRAEIVIRADGEPRVSLEPEEVAADELLQLLLCYGAKLRWSLRAEPEWVRDGFQRLSREVAVGWDGENASGPFEALPSAPHLRLNAERFDLTVARHERYVIQLYSDQRGWGYPCGSLPPRPLRANLVWHFIALARAIASRLNEEQRAATRPVVLEWCRAMFDDAAGRRDEISLNQHIATANRIFADRGDGLQSGLVRA